jgi:hypothetical protein
MSKAISKKRLAIELIYTQLTRLGVVTEKDKRQCEIIYNILRANHWIHLDNVVEGRVRDYTVREVYSIGARQLEIKDLIGKGE